MERDGHDDGRIKEILSLRNVAVVGASRHPEKAANFVPRYLVDHGFNVIPVNPHADCILGRRCYPDIGEVPGPIDIVDIFRPSGQVMPVVRRAVEKRPKVVWMQEGIHDPEAEELARREGIDVVFNRCMLAEHRRLSR